MNTLKIFTAAITLLVLTSIVQARCPTAEDECQANPNYAIDPQQSTPSIQATNTVFGLFQCSDFWGCNQTTSPTGHGRRRALDKYDTLAACEQMRQLMERAQGPSQWRFVCLQKTIPAWVPATNDKES